MNISFSSADTNFIKSQVDDGYYVNATELIRDAVRHMREQSRDKIYEEKRARLNAALQKGWDSIEAGRYVAYDKDFWKKVEREAEKMAAENVPFDPDVVGPEGQEPWIAD